MKFERNIEKQIDISLELLYTLSKMRNANLRGDDFMKSSDQMAIEWEMSKRTINDLCNKIDKTLKNVKYLFLQTLIFA